MTHTQHTPWEAVPFAGAWAVRDSRNSPIASGLSEPTARLIAAAPDLLAACKLIAANHPQAGGAISEAQLDWVRSAIARATEAA